ncbi:threonine aldolase [Actinoalloteichus sp. AHMU CJ021]|uniref:L-threonine aldolase n=1 Tax=Actinoalloteichus caeruleus DSM 43889 TaxID=1120930 RepID=A0ABT1JN20_ACTCY|nr:threonine aldolase [Actinoalloteichus sp. AHMU CJ021]MCP2333101.1 L-threonine aldolase [Actinoalloteichus caeruleus DSM 43889]
MWCDLFVTKLVPIDLRSDTVTKPDRTMRAAMADADVGDDVLDGDPTMRELEERCAQLLGMEAALWTPSGCMGNTIALMAHLQRGDSFLAPHLAHVLGNELGTAAWLAGGMPQALPWVTPGVPAASDITAASASAGPYYALRTRLFCLENTHNAAGGAVVAPDEHAVLVAAAREAGLRVHLDGARLWNASVAMEVPPAALTVGVDTAQVCLSKGLGAPVGSVVAGSAEFVAEARRLRKMLGGGVRQGGVLAAAGLVALDRVDQLAEDHQNARLLADGLREIGWQVDTPQTNIVLATTLDLPTTLSRLTALGVHASAMAGRVRMVTHRDVTRAQIKQVLRRIGKDATRPSGGRSLGSSRASAS